GGASRVPPGTEVRWHGRVLRAIHLGPPRGASGLLPVQPVWAGVPLPQDRVRGAGDHAALGILGHVRAATDLQLRPSQSRPSAGPPLARSVVLPDAGMLLGSGLRGPDAAVDLDVPRRGPQAVTDPVLPRVNPPPGSLAAPAARGARWAGASQAGRQA